MIRHTAAYARGYAMVVRKALVRAYGGEPLCRVVVGETERVVYIANPDKLPAVEAGDSSPVGFPHEDVFEFDAALYERLRDQWDQERHTDDALWKEAANLYGLPASG
jgi:hypothetical protein